MSLKNKQTLAILIGLSFLPIGYVFSKYDVSPIIGLPLVAAYIGVSAWLIARRKK